MKKKTYTSIIVTFAITFFLVISVCGGQCLASDVWYVKSDGYDGNRGNSWENAFSTIQRAVDAAQPFDEIWVAIGIYQPTTTIYIPMGIKLYGSFRGNESSPMDRILPSKNISSAELDLDIYTTMDGRRVMTLFELEDENVLDGFMMYHGYAGRYGDDSGGGIRVKGC